MRARAALLTLAVLCAATGPARPEEGQLAQGDGRYFMQFEGVWLGFVGLGGLTFDAAISADGYQVQAGMQSGGLAALFDKTTLTASATGALNAAGPQWGAYRLDHSYAAKRRVTLLQAGPSAGGVEALVSPAYRARDYDPAPQALRDAARDPLTAVLTLGLSVGQTRQCVGGVSVFDGKWVYRLELSPLGFQRLHRDGGFDGPALKCRMRLTPVAGYDAKERKEAQGWPAAEIWFGLLVGGRFAPPVFARIPFAVGDVALHLKAYRQPRVETVLPPAP
jgi:hypothetical protein